MSLRIFNVIIPAKSHHSSSLRDVQSIRLFAPIILYIGNNYINIILLFYYLYYYYG